MLVLGLLCVLLWALQPVGVVLDGRAQGVPPGTTARQLAASGLAKARFGDLIAVDGTVARRGGGMPPTLSFDGRVVAGSGRVHPGAVVTSAPGRDVRERVVTRLAATAIPVERSGRGPDRELRQLGAPGLARVTMGAVSRRLVRRVLIRPAVPMKVDMRPYPRGTPLVALTFDDGPWPGQTGRVLDILRSEGVPATFFMVGVRVRLAPALARSVVAAGYLVGNHTQTHLSLRGATPAQTAFQVATGAQTLRDHLGIEPRWFRSPGGAVTPAVRAEAAKVGERIVGWTVDPADWRKPSADVIARRVLKAVRPGAIVLLHDGGGDRSRTIEALPRIIAELRAMGYRFVTLDDL